MRYSAIKFNDVANAPGISVSVYLQGCDRRCPHCFNPETWDFEGGLPFTSVELDQILAGLIANGVKRNLCILGGEPMDDRNVFTTLLIIDTVRKKYPDIKIYLWTGFTYEELLTSPNPKIKIILDNLDYLIDGPYINSKRDISLQMRGSSNQKIIDLKKNI